MTREEALANIAEALALYRSRVDSLAKKWYDTGVSGRDRGPLLDVVRQAFRQGTGPA